MTTTLRITNSIDSADGDCSITYSGLEYKKWTIFLDIIPEIDKGKIRHVKYILPISYPHRVIQIKNSVQRFEYSTCGYQNNTIQCLIDVKEIGQIKKSHFLDLVKPRITIITF